MTTTSLAITLYGQCCQICQCRLLAQQNVSGISIFVVVKVFVARVLYLIIVIRNSMPVCCYSWSV